MSRATEITVLGDGGACLFTVRIEETGVRSCSGKLLIECGDGQRVSLDDPLRLRLFAAIFDAGVASVAS